MLAAAWAGRGTADKSPVETQTPLPISLETRADARAALGRAFDEAARMPGTLLPHELLDELTSVSRRIVEEVADADEEAYSFENGSGPEVYNVEHSIDATIVGVLIGRQLLPTDDLEELGLGLFLQDIGKLALPPAVVHKPGPLAPDEWDLMMQHTLLGLEFLRDDSVGLRAKSVVRSHHERWNGSGYPGGLVGEEASLFARIAAVADVFDAMTSERYHAPAWPASLAVQTIAAGAGSDFDPEVVAAFADVVRP
jgi:HD-GYP domain-containing protein (c-di-GMP phosphodiesterase class II)